MIYQKLIGKLLFASEIHQGLYGLHHEIRKTRRMVLGTEQVLSRRSSSEQHYMSSTRYVESSSNFYEIECWFHDYMKKEASSLGFYQRNTKSESIIVRFKRNLPAFDGMWHKEDFMSWVDDIEDFFEEVSPPVHLKCKIVLYKMEGAARIWWNQFQNDRVLSGREEITSWPWMKNLLLNKFSPTKCLIELPTEQKSIRDGEKHVCSLSNGFYHTAAVTEIVATTPAENTLKQIAEIENTRDSNKNGSSAGVFVNVQSKEMVTVKPANCSTICPSQSVKSKAKQYEKDADGSSKDDESSERRAERFMPAYCLAKFPSDLSSYEHDNEVSCEHNHELHHSISCIDVHSDTTIKCKNLPPTVTFVEAFEFEKPTIELQPNLSHMVAVKTSATAELTEHQNTKKDIDPTVVAITTSISDVSKALKGIELQQSRSMVAESVFWKVVSKKEHISLVVPECAIMMDKLRRSNASVGRSCTLKGLYPCFFSKYEFVNDDTVRMNFDPGGRWQNKLGMEDEQKQGNMLIGNNFYLDNVGILPDPDYGILFENEIWGNVALAGRVHNRALWHALFLTEYLKIARTGHCLVCDSMCLVIQYTCLRGFDSSMAWYFSNDNLQHVRALRKGEHFVAVTGYKIHDTPTRNEFDIRLSISTQGTEVAEHSPNIILAGHHVFIVQIVCWDRTRYVDISKVRQFKRTVDVYGDVLRAYDFCITRGRVILEAGWGWNDKDNANKERKLNMEDADSRKTAVNVDYVGDNIPNIIETRYYLLGFHTTSLRGVIAFFMIHNNWTATKYIIVALALTGSMGIGNVLNLIEAKMPCELYTSKGLEIIGDPKSLGQFVGGFTSIFEGYTNRLQLITGISLWKLIWMHSYPYCPLTITFPSCDTYNNNLTHGRVIPWKGSDEYIGGYLEFQVKDVAVCSHLGAIWMSGRRRRAAKLFYKLVSGLDPPMGFDGDARGSKKIHMSSLEDELFRGRDGLMQCILISF